MTEAAMPREGWRARSLNAWRTYNFCNMTLHGLRSTRTILIKLKELRSADVDAAEGTIQP